jgi:hypothetical protein
MAVRATGAGDAARVRQVRRAPAGIPGHGRPLWVAAAALAALAVVLAVLLPEHGLPWLAWDSHTYWEAARAVDPYENARVGDIGAYLYSPAFLQLLVPAVLLPWPIFLYLWAAATVAVAWRLLARRGLPRRWLVPLAALAFLDVWAGNINVFIAAAVVLGLRWPGAWSFLALTKVSPGLGVVWFAARGEWRHLATAVGVTVAIATISALLDPDAWRTWISVLISNNQVENLSGDLPIMAAIRFPVALALAWWGGRSDRPWVMPIAVLLLLPVIWPNGFAILIGCAALVRLPQSSRHDAERPPRTAAVGRAA